MGVVNIYLFVCVYFSVSFICDRAPGGVALGSGVFEDSAGALDTRYCIYSFFSKYETIIVLIYNSPLHLHTLPVESPFTLICLNPPRHLIPLKRFEIPLSILQSPLPGGIHISHSLDILVTLIRKLGPGSFQHVP